MAKLDALERLVTHHSVTIDTQFRTKADEKTKAQCNCPVPDMKSLASMIQAQIGLRHSYDRGDVVLTLQDVKLYTNREDKAPTHLALLINSVDKNGSTTVLKNTETDARIEIAPKHEEGEGYEVSAHMVISLSGKMRTYDMTYTPTPGISTGRINSFLNRILFKASIANESKFTCKTLTNQVSPTNNKVLKILYKPTFELTGLLDQQLFKKINDEGLSDVVLIKDEYTTINAPDVNATYIPKQTTLKLVPNHGTDVIGWIKSVAEYFGNETNGGYDKLKIKFQEPDTGKPRQVDFTTKNIKLDSLEKTFIKKSILSNFDSRLKDSYDKIDSSFIIKMIDIM
ncbi:hypothetical protein R1917_09725 [Citrobacter koseri]|uniref:hypothetical protein n=1 Tax=Citrobacter koseri TaxID=545 RepID=UPI0029423844|nr:hypothetical protein [Citrobacter koseri]WOJ32587.1 hypothetical protein R1917_09725 [Citrobacter koseri]WOJ36760.1 hypothetical protein R1243_07270 [Citrobacter koseri]